MQGMSSKYTMFALVYESVANPDPYIFTVVPPAMLPYCGLMREIPIVST